MELYFAYGSNLDIQQVRERCQGCDVRKISIGYLPEHRLAFTQFYEPWGGGVADITQSPDSCVWGILYELTIGALKLLDAYEGYPTDYDRTQYNILTPEGASYTAWVYTVKRKDGDFIPPSKRYLDILKRTSEASGFPVEYLSYLNQIKTAEEAFAV
jgi:gamma-glutamylcyclotransferase